MATPKKIGTHVSYTTRLVDPKDLILNPENERDYVADAASMIALRQSIASEGVLSPLEIYDDGTVADGNRRLFNVQLLLAEGVDVGPLPTIIIPRPATEVDAVLHRLNRNEAQQFSPLEQGRAFAKLRDAGLNNTQISARSPFTSMHIGNMLTLHDMSDEVKALVRDGKISATLAVEAVRKYGEEILAQAVAHATTQGRDRATLRNIEAVAPVPEAETTAEATPVGPTSVVPVEAPPFATGEAEATAEATAEPEGEAVAEATADTVDPETLSDAAPNGPTTTAVEDITPGSVPASTGTTSFTAKALVQMIAPTIQSLFEAMENGTLKEKAEALREAGDDLKLFLAQAKRLGLFD